MNVEYEYDIEQMRKHPDYEEVKEQVKEESKEKVTKKHSKED
jgi:hypothetical protein